MGTSNVYVVVTSPYGPIALTVDQIRTARSIADEIVVTDPPMDIERDDASGAERPRLVDAREVARLFGIAPTWLLQRARERRIPHYRVGKYVRFDPDEVRAALRQGTDRHAD